MLYDAFILLGLLILASALALPFGDPDKVAFQDCLVYFLVARSLFCLSWGLLAVWRHDRWYACLAGQTCQ